MKSLYISYIKHMLYFIWWLCLHKIVLSACTTCIIVILKQTKSVMKVACMHERWHNKSNNSADNIWGKLYRKNTRESFWAGRNIRLIFIGYICQNKLIWSDVNTEAFWWFMLIFISLIYFVCMNYTQTTRKCLFSPNMACWL